MKKFNYWIAVGLCWFLLAAGESQPESGTCFTLTIEQDGQTVAIQNHEVYLQKKPFAIVISFPDKVSPQVLVNASFQPLSFQSAKEGSPTEDLAGFLPTPMAEWLFNKHELLIINDEAAHYWYYNNASDHRFNEVTQKNGTVVCKRTIARIIDFHTRPKDFIEVEQVDKYALYLVFLKAQWTMNYSKILEEQRDYVKICFKGAEQKMGKRE